MPHLIPVPTFHNALSISHGRAGSDMQGQHAMLLQNGRNRIELDYPKHDTLAPNKMAFTIDVLSRGLAFLHYDLALMPPDPGEMRHREGADRLRGPIACEVQGRILKDCDQVREGVLFLFPRAEFAAFVEIREAAELVGSMSGAMIFLLIWSPMSVRPFNATMSAKLAPGGTLIAP